MGRIRYTFEERLMIGSRIYHGELNRYQAAIEYEISVDTCRNYMRMYRAKHNLPAKGMQAKPDAASSEGENT